MSVLSRSWLWPRKTTADWLYEENLSLLADLCIAEGIVGRRPVWVYPTWMTGIAWG